MVDNIEDFFLFLHFNVLANICRELITCPDCAANVVVIDQHLKRMGFAHRILVKCSICDWMKPFYTSPKTIQKVILKVAKHVNKCPVIGF